MLRIVSFFGLFWAFLNLTFADNLSLPKVELIDTLESNQNLVVKMRQFFLRFRKLFDQVHSRKQSDEIIPGANRFLEYLPLLKGKRVAILANQTSVVNNKGVNTHLVDTLLAQGINIVKIFIPEHGFRGKKDAGEKLNDSIDPITNIPLISLYGKKQKPTSKDFAGVDVVIYDIQDVGVRFYTYISTFQLLLERCLEEDVPLLVLDRPNPNGFYVDGPILDKEFKSMVGMQSIPVVYGMTIGEYAQMLYLERLLNVDFNFWADSVVKNQNFKLHVITCIGYTHAKRYTLPIAPSPNLPNMQAIYLYPSLCFFEGTNVSVGRGTSHPFQCYGNPSFPDSLFVFTPVSIPGATNPPFATKRCYGYDLQNIQLEKLKTDKNNPNSLFTLQFLLQAYRILHKDSINFFKYKKHFHKLAGSSKLYEAVIKGMDEALIRQKWISDLDSFRRMRKKYLLYEDF